VITKLAITNFQSYEKAVIYPGSINIIIGRNNSGKTAILRALRLLFFNEPEGSDFVRYGAKDAIVEVVYDGHVIKRVKGAQNIYELDGSVFSNFGRDIPQEIVSVLGFSAVKVDRKVYELNYESAHEAPFFVSETQVTAGKIFSKLGEKVIGDLVVLDLAINAANSELRKLNTELAVLSKQKENVLNEVSKYSKLDEIDLQVCRDQLIFYEKLSYHLETVKNIKQELDLCDKDILLYEQLIDVDVAKLEEDFYLMSRLQEQLDMLMNVEDELNYIERNMKSVNELVNVDMSVLESQIFELQGLQESLASLSKLQQDLSTVDFEMSRVESLISSNLKEYEASLEDYKKWLVFQQKCPVCYRDISERDIYYILEELRNDKRSIAP